MCGNGTEMNRLKTLRGKSSIFFKKMLNVTFQDKTTNLMFTLKKLFTFFQILFQICIVQTRVNIGHKHSIEKHIFIDIGNKFNKRKLSFI